MTNFQCFSESLGLTSALNYQGIFGHGTLHLTCLRCLQRAGEVSRQGRADMEHDGRSLQTEISDAISRPNLSVGNHISPFKLLASLSWIKCSLPSWKCCRVPGTAAVTKLGAVAVWKGLRYSWRWPPKPRYLAAEGSTAEDSPVHWEPQEPF